jgi:hypothetical protein
MFRDLKNLSNQFCSPKRTSAAGRGGKKNALRFESLEKREMMTGNAAGLAEIHQFGIATFTAGFAAVAAQPADAAPAQPGLALNTNLFPSGAASNVVDYGGAAPGTGGTGSSPKQIGNPLNFGVAPAAPEFNVGVDSTTQVTLSWAPTKGVAGFDPGLAGYTVEVQTHNDLSRGVFDGIWHQVGNVGADATSYTITGLNPGATYSFKLVAYNPYGGTGTESPIVPFAPPAAPTLTANTASDSQINLSWTPQSGVANYTVQGSTATGRTLEASLAARLATQLPASPRTRPTVSA